MSEVERTLSLVSKKVMFKIQNPAMYAFSFRILQECCALRLRYFQGGLRCLVGSFFRRICRSNIGSSYEIAVDNHL
jgi:hypothetical protein